LLNTRNRAGRAVVEVVADDLASHGPPVVAALREHDPAAYARLASDLVAFKALLRAHASPDKPAPPAGEPSPRERLAASSSSMPSRLTSRSMAHGRQALVEGTKAFAEERDRKQIILFPIRIDNAVMDTPEPWARKFRDQRNIGDFRDWKNHDSYQRSFKRVLRDLTVPREPSPHQAMTIR
jgi:hypothetical protein